VDPDGTKQDSDMKIVERTVSGMAILEVVGRLDLTSVPNLRSELLARLGEAEKGAILLIDLSGVPFMDSSGIATLIEGRKLSLEKGLSLRLFGLGEQVQQLFELAGLAPAFEIFVDEAAAIAGLP
jgi:anti-sigma B factor antagonist